MEVHLSPELQAKVERAAAENKSGAEEYVKQLVEHYVDHEAWFRQQVTRGLRQLDKGEFLTHEEVGGSHRTNVSQIDGASLVTRRR